MIITVTAPEDASLARDYEKTKARLKDYMTDAADRFKFEDFGVDDVEQRFTHTVFRDRSDVISSNLRRACEFIFVIMQYCHPC